MPGEVAAMQLIGSSEHSWKLVQIGKRNIDLQLKSADFKSALAVHFHL